MKAFIAGVVALLLVGGCSLRMPFGEGFIGWEEVVPGVERSMVLVRGEGKFDQHFCSGWFVGLQKVMTANHCAYIVPEEKVLGRRPRADLLMFRTEALGAPLPIAKDVPMGQEVLHMGLQMRAGDPYTQVIIGHVLTRRMQVTSLWDPGRLMGERSHSGMSGGPVVNRRGEVVGIGVAVNPHHDMTFISAAEEIRALVEEVG